MTEATNDVDPAPCLEQLLGQQARDWMRGRSEPVSAYLAREPALAGDPEAKIELIHQEIIFRLRSGERPRLEDYLTEYPDLAKPVSEILQLHSAVSLPTQVLPAPGTLMNGDAANGTAANRSLPIIPGYEIERVLGSGGMAVVYLARDLVLKRWVALKILHPGAQDDLAHRERFEREAAAAAKCQHPNLVQIFEVGEQDGAYFLALEYVDGGTLAKAMAGAPQRPQAAATLVEKLARAIDHMHSRGVVHRDLKPANVMLTPKGEPKVTDFGLARLEDRSMRTEVGTLLGTLAYMAPEQASAGAVEVGPPADIHALGAILYEALTGRPPYRSSTPEKTLQRLLFDDVARPSSLQPETPRDLEAICLKCLCKAPNHRYATAAELSEDLRRFLDGRPTLARPVTTLERAWRWCRRNPTLAAVSAAFATAAIIAVSVFLGLTHRHNLELRAEVKRTAAKAAAARRNYEAARSTIQSMLARLRDARFAGTPRIMEASGDQMEDALAFYNRAREADDAHDPAIRYDTAQAFGLLSTVLAGRGNIRRAEDQVRQALALISGLRSEWPGNTEYLELHTLCTHRLGIYLGALGHDDEGLAASLESVRLGEQLAHASPENVSHQDLVATCEDAYASRLCALNRPSEARDHYRRAIEIRESLDPSKNLDLRQRHAETLMNDGRTLWQMGQSPQAQARFRQAEKLILSIPAERRNVISLGQIYVNWSGTLFKSSRFDEAIAQANLGLAVLEPRVELEPNDAPARDVCLQLHGNRGLALSALGKHRESAREWERVIALAPKPVPISYHAGLAVQLAQVGELARALDEARIVTSSKGCSSGDCYNLACLYCLCAVAARDSQSLAAEQRSRQVEAHIRDALRWLKAAREAGAFNDTGVCIHAKEDPDLAILADRAEFRQIIEPPQNRR
jgi:eukaryotic-like serine/threonine-protein kinase